MCQLVPAIATDYSLIAAIYRLYFLNIGLIPYCITGCANSLTSRASSWRGCLIAPCKRQHARCTDKSYRRHCTNSRIGLYGTKTENIAQIPHRQAPGLRIGELTPYGSRRSVTEACRQSHWPRPGPGHDLGSGLSCDRSCCLHQRPSSRFLTAAFDGLE